jgi:hypothetical protein
LIKKVGDRTTYFYKFFQLSDITVWVKQKEEK